MARSSQPTARVTPKGAKALRRGHPWLYRTELLEPPDDAGARRGGAGGGPAEQPHRPGLLRAALAARAAPAHPQGRRRGAGGRGLLPPPPGAVPREARAAARPGRPARWCTARRTCCPGLFVDRYGAGLIAADALRGHGRAQGVRWRARWPSSPAPPTWCAATTPRAATSRACRARCGCCTARASARFSYHEGENLFEVDLLEDMKTGAFLDQVDNHLRAGELAPGRGARPLQLPRGLRAGARRAAATRCSRWSRTRRPPSAPGRTPRATGAPTSRWSNANAFDVLRRFDRGRPPLRHGGARPAGAGQAARGADHRAARLPRAQPARPQVPAPRGAARHLLVLRQAGARGLRGDGALGRRGREAAGADPRAARRGARPPGARRACRRPSTSRRSSSAPCRRGGGWPQRCPAPCAAASPA